MLAPLLAITHNRPAYEQLCRRILTNFPTTTNPYVAERLAKDCLVLPNSGVDLLWADKMTDVAVTLGSGEASNPFFQTSKALSKYRQERFREAIEWAAKTTNSNQIYANAQACAVLAMAHWQLGQKDEARAQLAKGDTLAPNIATRRDDPEIGDSWVAWLFARIQLDEATALIQPAAPAENLPGKP